MIMKCDCASETMEKGLTQELWTVAAVRDIGVCKGSGSGRRESDRD